MLYNLKKLISVTLQMEMFMKELAPLDDGGSLP